MNAIHSKSAFVYGEVRRALQCGRYAPGQRIDPNTLAKEFRTSATPVRFALYRLVGEGLIADHARAGLHVPLPTEVAMYDLYEWMEQLLLMACERGVTSTTRPREELDLGRAGDDAVKLTWKLFDAIARAADQRSLQRAVRQANDQLAPIRRAKLGLVEHAFEEILELARHWQARDVQTLKAAISEYHERRKRLVPRIVDLLVERSELPH